MLAGCCVWWELATDWIFLGEAEHTQEAVRRTCRQVVYSVLTQGIRVWVSGGVFALCFAVL